MLDGCALKSYNFNIASIPGCNLLTTPRKRYIGAFETEDDSGDECNEIIEVSLTGDGYSGISAT